MSDGRNAQGYYSQNDEEKYILDWTPKSGNLLDIGAWWPTNLSNSRALIERGWSATLVEPSPGPMRVLLEEYRNKPEITLIQAGVMESREDDNDIDPIEMNVTDYPVSTSNHEVFLLWKDSPESKYLRKLWVPHMSLWRVLRMTGAVDFVSIDAEGKSVNIAKELLTLSSLDDLPQCFCVEHDGHHEELCRLATEKRYSKFHLTAENLVAAR